MIQNASRCPRAFIFDCDGTLIDSMGIWLDVQPRLLATYGVSTVPSDFKEYECLSVEDECRAYHERWGVGDDWRAVYERLHEMLCEAYEHEAPARPGILSLLSAAASQGIPCAVATSTPQDLVERGLRANGLLSYFDVIVTTEEAGASKEHPDVYHLALERLMRRHRLKDVSCSDVWVFEDAVFGLKSSGTAGYRRVGIFDPAGRMKRDDVRANCDLFIESYEDISLGALMEAMG